MIETFPDAEALMRGAAGIFVAQARQAVQERGRFSVALAGGSTPKRAYQLLAENPFRSEIDWSRIHVFWSDERCVPPDDASSNYRMTRTALLDHVPIPTGHVYRIHGERSPVTAAKDYEKVLAQHFGTLPVRFDLAILGLGTDGHTASLFPGMPVLRERTRRATEVYVAELDLWRVTLTAPVLNAARVVVFLVSGTEKSEVLREVIFGPREPERLPAQLVQPAPGEVWWFVDCAAASRLPAYGGTGFRTNSSHADG